jgi:hypothetical protein
LVLQSHLAAWPVGVFWKLNLGSTRHHARGNLGRPGSRPGSFVLFAAALFALGACPRPPARVIVGFADTVVINSLRPLQLSVQVLDAAGHELPDTGVRFQWTSGVHVPVSHHGVVTCTQAGDATLRASLGPLVASVLVRCRPVHDVLGGGELNFVLGDPPRDLSFAPVDSAGRPVTLFTVGVSYDSAVVTLEGWRIHARAPGATGVDISIGDSSAHWYVQVYERAPTLEGIGPNQRLAVPVRLAGGEMHSLQLPPSPPTYHVAMLPDRDTVQVPRLTIVGANCLRSQFPDGYRCFALPGASIIAYHPREDRPKEEWSGTIAVASNRCSRYEREHHRTGACASQADTP